MPFPKGVSGNPEGRRVERDARKHVLRELCQRDTHIVYDIMMNIITNEAAKEAARALLIKFHQETAWGKAEQSLKLETVNADSTDVTRLKADELNMLVTGRFEELLRNLYARGTLGEYTKKFDEEGVKVEGADITEVIAKKAKVKTKKKKKEEKDES